MALYTVAPSDTGGGTEVSGRAMLDKLLLLMFLAQIQQKLLMLQLLNILKQQQTMEL